MATSASAGKATQAGGKREVTQEDLQADIAQLKDDLAQLAKQFAATGEHSMNTAKRAASESVEQLKAQGEAKLAELRVRSKDMEAQLEEAVREKPITSLAIAAAVGFFFAILTRR